MIGSGMRYHKMGERIRELRLKHGWTQDELAERAGTLRPLVSRIEAAIHMPAIPTILAYAEALQVQPSEIFKVLDEEAEKTPFFPRPLCAPFGTEADTPSAEFP